MKNKFSNIQELQEENSELKAKNLELEKINEWQWEKFFGAWQDRVRKLRKENRELKNKLGEVKLSNLPTEIKTKSQIIKERFGEGKASELLNIRECMEEYANQFKSIQGDKEGVWISVLERLPEVQANESIWVLGYVSDGTTANRGVMDMCYDGYVFLSVQGELRSNEVITHWQPLPNPPTIKQTEK